MSSSSRMQESLRRQRAEIPFHDVVDSRLEEDEDEDEDEDELERLWWWDLVLSVVG